MTNWCRGLSDHWTALCTGGDHQTHYTHTMHQYCLGWGLMLNNGEYERRPCKCSCHARG